MIVNKGYYIVYNPGTYNLMDILGENDISSIHIISYITNLNGFDLNRYNYIDYLNFDFHKIREGLVEILAIESYAALYIGNQISKFAFESRVIHADGKRRKINEIIIKERKKPKAVFITAMSANFPTAVAISIVLNHGEIPVIIGGIHVSTSPDDVEIFIRKYCPHPELVTQVIGAGDSVVIPNILYDLDNNFLKAQYRGYKSIENGVWILNDNVKLMPPMKMDSLRRFPLVGKFLAKKMRIVPAAPFLGCPYSCNFCSISTLPKKHRRFTMRSVDDFLIELETIQKSGGFDSRFFFFLPDNLLLGGKYLEAILDGIIERELKVNYATQISIDVASNEKLLRKLRLAGATHFFIGFESLDIRNLEYIGKHILKDIRKSELSVSQYYARQIQKIQNHGISIHGAFIFGLPYDYFNTLENNTGIEIADFCIKNHIGLQPCSLTDLPGSRAFRESQESGNWLYGKKCTIEYLVSLCLTDLTEINRRPPHSLDKSPLTVASMSFEAIQRAASNKYVLKNAVFAIIKSFNFPTHRGQKFFRERLIDSIYSFVIQLIVALYKDHGEKVAYSKHGIRGAFERLYNLEKSSAKKKYFKTYVQKFKDKN